MLTEKNRRFVEEYLVDLNATQAAIRSGYSTKTARDQGYQLLTKREVRDAVDKALAERSRRTGVNVDRVLLEMARVAFANIVDVANIDNAAVNDDLNRDDAAAILSVRAKTLNDGVIEREVKMHDKSKMIELLGRHLGMFNDKLQIENAPAPLSVQDQMASAAAALAGFRQERIENAEGVE